MECMEYGTRPQGESLGLRLYMWHRLHLTSPASLQLRVALLQLLLRLGQRGLQLLHLGLQGGLRAHQLGPLPLHRGSAVMEGLATKNLKKSTDLAHQYSTGAVENCFRIISLGVCSLLILVY